MTGGTITGVSFHPQLARAEIRVRDGGQHETVTVQWPAPTCSIQPGDQLRWRAELALWTTRDRELVDVVLFRVVINTPNPDR